MFRKKIDDHSANKPHHEKNNMFIREKKGADQLRSNCEADQCLCFRDTDSTINSIIYACTAAVPGLYRNCSESHCWFSMSLTGSP